jgi:hypothetical protein
LADVATVLHADDAQVIFFVDPDQERLIFVVEDATSLRPVTASVGVLKVSNYSILRMSKFTWRKRSPSLNKKWSAIN